LFFPSLLAPKQDAPAGAPPPPSSSAAGGASSSSSSSAVGDAAPASRDPKTALLAELYAAELQMQQITYELGTSPGGTAQQGGDSSAGGSRPASRAE
jgi:hypothetical protein